jgi:hypothetical protein
VPPLGVRDLALWLAPAHPGHLVVAQVALARDLADAEERLVCSQQPFDR